MLHGDRDTSTGSPGADAFQKHLKWEVAFLVGAGIVTGAGVLTVLNYIFHFQLACFSFTMTIFLLFFGLLMVVLDFPLSTLKPPQFVSSVREQIYKFVLFMTRFTGRGLWYLFLSTMVFSALRDVMWVGLRYIFALYLLILGGAALFYGVRMSLKLDKVRQAFLGSRKTIQDLVPGQLHDLSKEHFRNFANALQIPGQLPVEFTDSELDFIFGALAFKPLHNEKVSIEELKYWLLPTETTFPYSMTFV